MLHENIEVPTPVSLHNTTHNSGPGAHLRRIREAKHLSIDEMTKRLRLSRERLVQLENDDYHQMGASAFAIGYIRSYANQLGMAKEEISAILKTFAELNLDAEIPSNTPQLIHEKMDQVAPNTVRRITYLLLIALIVSVGYWWYNNHSGLPTKLIGVATSQNTAHTEALPSTSDVTNMKMDTISLPVPALNQSSSAVTVPNADPAPLDTKAQ